MLTETDITAQREAEELRASGDLMLREVLDACAVNLMMCRIGDGTILYRNPAWVRLFGPVETAHALYRDTLDRSDFLAELLPTKALDDFQTWLIKADGTAFPALISARIVDYQGEELIVSSTRDMT
ncbi:MAG: PAS domain-containing protein [Pseudomonadota bacterium]